MDNRMHCKIKTVFLLKIVQNLPPIRLTPEENLMKTLFILLSTLMIPLLLPAQNLTGRIINKEQQPVMFANVILLNTDSAFVSGGISDEEGRFDIPFSEKVVWVKVSYIGYQDQVSAIPSDRSDMGNILLAEDTHWLGEVIVKGDLPKTRIKGDAMVTTVAGSLLEKAGTAADVLSKVPGVTRKGEDLNVFGRGTPQVYINGREVRDPSELTQLTSDHIRSVEVITHPGVRYDKTVKAVIRIQTKKHDDEGFGFADRAYVNYNDEWSYLDQLNLYYRQNKLDLAALLSYADKSEWRRLDVVQSTYLDHDWVQKMNSSQTFATRAWTGNLTLNYAFDPDHSAGANYRYRRYPKSTNAVSLQTNIDKDQLFFEKSQAQILGEMPETRQEANGYYKGKVGAWQIDVNGTWLRTTEEVAMQTAENIRDREEEDHFTSVHTSSNTRNTLYAAKLSFSHSLFDGTFSFGSEYSHTSRTSTFRNDEGMLPDDDSRIKEGLIAGFAEYERSFGPVNVQGGLRLENVGFDYYQGGVFQEEQSKKYTNWFPALSLTLPLGPVETQLSYTSGIERPSYQMLRSRVDYVNRYTYESGNPFLRPAITHTLALEVVYTWWQLYADYQHLQDAFVSYSSTYSADDPTIALLGTANAPAYDVVNLMLTAAPVIGCWSPQFSVELYKQRYTVDAPGRSEETRALDRPSFAVRWQNGLQLPYGFIINADVEWEGRTDRDNSSYKAVAWANASLYKDFFGGRLSFLLNANDLFRTYRNDYILYYGRLRTMRMNEKYSRRSIGLTVHYKFNAKKNKYKGTGAGASQKYRL